ncbi:acetyltransferase [Clostridium beijerinckii]|uniref:acetyltransferase n=1 Tax=Clostridium beijerinckii TaxID=1520 RepID=UPI00149427E4|nr:acetyltransferase [Clostridium beijerinckii]NOW04160.1 sugar O-acyltransferase (sialic acid O-acetyltransferase NeuD family) [Clostridium beijerinckii]NYC02699.1 sugar O-acyltransferase (sialic acid O-acetyltransferase NeuD family) [Clostridium beijerinckii]
MDKNKKLVIIGDGEFAEIAYEYFTYDSPYTVEAFAVEKQFITQKSLFGLPVIAFEEMEQTYSTKEYEVFTAITFTNFNRVRTRLYNEAKGKGYSFASYISSKAFVWRNAKIGENSFIFEDNTIQYNVEIGNNVVLWSGNHIGHRTKIKDNSFISSHVVVSGYCEVGENSFLGVNSTFVNNVSIGKNSFVAAGALITKNYGDNLFLKGSPAKPDSKSSLELFNIKE